MKKYPFCTKETQDDAIKHLGVLICSGVLILGCFLPWLQLGAIFVNRGIDNPVGAIVLVAAFISICVAFFNLSKKESKLIWVYILTALIGLGVGIFDLQEVHAQAQEVAKSVGSGLYVVLLSSIALIVVSIALFGKKLYFATPTVVVVIALLCLGPLALPLVWLHPHYKIITKVIVTVIVIAFTVLLSYLVGYIYSNLMKQTKTVGNL